MAVMREKSPLVTAANSLRILTLFSDESPELSITEISQTLTLAKSTISRIVQTLVMESILERVEMSGKYRLGPLLLELGLVASELNPLSQSAGPFLKRLRDMTQESCYLLTLDRFEGICVLSYESAHTVGAYIRTGLRSDLPDSVCGLTILAHLESEDMDLALQNAGVKQNIIQIRMNDIIKTVNDIQDNGYACLEEPKSPWLVTIACPIFNPAGSVTGAIAVTSPVQRLSPKSHTPIIHAVSRAAQDISKKLFLSRK